jgi:hypothetical protein
MGQGLEHTAADAHAGDTDSLPGKAGEVLVAEEHPAARINELRELGSLKDADKCPTPGEPVPGNGSYEFLGEHVERNARACRGV